MPSRTKNTNIQMSIHTLLNRLSLPIRCLLLVALCGTATAAFAPQVTGDTQLPQGNQECDSDSAEMTTAGITGTGVSLNTGDDTSLARWRAFNDLNDKLGEASGVVCNTCEVWRRCFREAKRRAGTLTVEFLEIMPVPETHAGGWICEATWKGKYKIRCKPC